MMTERSHYVIRPDTTGDAYGIFDTAAQAFVGEPLPVVDWALQGLVMRLNEQQQMIDRLQAASRPAAARGGGLMTNHRIYGYFTDAGQTEPAYDPGLNVDCPVCQQRLATPVKTISVRADDTHSYFYRVHKSCHEGLTEAQTSALDGLIVDAIVAAQNVN